jgi:hypothetical protein
MLSLCSPSKDTLSESLKEGMCAGFLPITLEADVHSLIADTVPTQHLEPIRLYTEENQIIAFLEIERKGSSVSAHNV